MRTETRERLLGALDARASPFTDEEMLDSAIVVSPHFDDESLGCGGTLLRKTDAGARVGLVFMTDGAASHASAGDPSHLAATRAAEGRDAAEALGVSADRVRMLGFPETRLAKHEADAVERLTEILRAEAPRSLFVPHRGEPLLWSADHRVTARAAFAAAERSGLPLAVHEYPVWMWRQWPFTPFGGPRTEKWWYLRQSAVSACGRRFVRQFDRRVDVGGVADRKRAALERHASQMSRPEGRASWATLADVAGGEFLACFFRSSEYFRTTRVGPRATLPADGGAPAHGEAAR